MGIGSGPLERVHRLRPVERGAHKVDCRCGPWNDRARRLYEKFGFAVQGHSAPSTGAATTARSWDDLSMAPVLDEDRRPALPTSDLSGQNRR